MKKVPRTLLIGVATAALAGGGIVIWRSTRNPPAAAYETVEVSQGPLIARVTATGTLSALVTVLVGSQVSGRVQAIYADWNSTVKQGQLIAKIDPALFQAAVEQSRANLAAAQGNLLQARVKALDAERQYVREKALKEKSLVAQADLDTMQANADAAKAGVQQAVGQVEQAKANLHQAEVNLQYCDIISPTNGTIISRSVDPGQTVAASLQAPTLFTIAQDLRKMQVDTNIPEADVGKLSAGMEATFTVDAFPSERFKGVVRQIRNAPQTLQNVVTYDAVIDVENPDLKLRPGMTANATLVYAERPDALRVPNAALRFRPTPDMLAAVGGAGRAAKGRAPGGGGGGPRAGAREAPPADQKAVWVLRDTGPERVTVHVGVSDGTSSEVVDGELRPGDKVITDAPEAGAAHSPVGQPPPGGFRRML